MTKITDDLHDDGEDVIDEIRAVRHAIWEHCDHDPYKLVAYYMELERTDPGPYIPAPDLEASGKSAA